MTHLTLVRASNIGIRALFLFVLASTQNVELVGSFGLVTSLSAWVTYLLTLEMSTNRMRRIEKLKNKPLKSRLTGVANCYYLSVWGLLSIIVAVSLYLRLDFDNILVSIALLTSADVFFSELVRTSTISGRLGVAAGILTVRYFISSVILILMSFSTHLDISDIVLMNYVFALAACFLYFAISNKKLYCQFRLGVHEVRWFALVLRKTIMTIGVGTITKLSSVMDRSLVAAFSTPTALGYYVLFSAVMGAIIALIESETTSRFLNTLSKTVGTARFLSNAREYLQLHTTYTMAGIAISYLVFGVLNSYFDFIPHEIYMSLIAGACFFIGVGLTNSATLLLILLERDTVVLKSYFSAVILTSSLGALFYFLNFNLDLFYLLCLLSIFQWCVFFTSRRKLEVI
jgi:hypothetical protein